MVNEHEQRLRHILLNSLQPLLANNTINVAYSGGVDSHVLLHLLWGLRETVDCNIQAIHINHGMSLHADQWQAHCAEVCRHLNVIFQTSKVHVTKKPRQSLEALARQARYQAITEKLGKGAVVLLGHHADDQLETLLLQLKRGAGINGLTAMGGSKKLYGLHLIRPFLEISQQQLLDYAEKHNLRWIEDNSNQDNRFDRNFLRNQIIPQLQARWPELAKTAGRSAQLCAKQSRLLEQSCQEKLEDMLQDNSIRIDKLRKYSAEWQAELIHLWLSSQGVRPPSYQQTQQILAMLEAKEDRLPQVDWGRVSCRRFDNRLFLLRRHQWMRPNNTNLTENNEVKLEADLGYLSLYKLVPEINAKDGAQYIDVHGAQVDIRFSPISQPFHPHDQPHSKPLKQWYKLWKIPPWTRRQCLQFWVNDLLVAILVDKKFILAKSSESNKPTHRLFWFADQKMIILAD
jgi:tRNA(Ile)-lysidine synthase